MKKHNESAVIEHEPANGKPRFRRKRLKVLKPVGEICVDGAWRTRTAKDRKFAGPARFKVAGLYVAGKRVRRFFATEAEARTFIEAQTVRQGNLGARAAHVDGRLVEDAVECEAMLKAHGVRLLDAVRDFLAARERLRDFPVVPLAEAAGHYATLLADRARSSPSRPPPENREEPRWQRSNPPAAQRKARLRKRPRPGRHGGAGAAA